MSRSSAIRLSLMLLLTSGLLIACAGQQGPPGPVGPAGPAGPQGPAGPPGRDATASQEYIGSEKCGECHEGEYAKFVLSGHPYKLTRIVNAQPPTFPFDNLTGGVQQPPEGYTWDDITYVIGGFAWKARFIDKNGYIITGDAEATTQYNFANRDVGKRAGWVAYHAGEEKPYNCGTCHTTGYRPEGHQDDLEGIIGTWALPGIQCEECHGPGSRHASNPYGVRMVLDRSSQLCGECHVRGDPAQVDAKGGFIRHHEQFEELYNSKHFALSCITCHDPHASAVYSEPNLNPQAGIRQTCESCHWQNLYQNNPKHFSVTCTDCHMPPMVKSAQGNLDIFTADLRSHLFSINPDPAAPQFSEDGGLTMPYITLEYACMQCHNGEKATPRSLEELGKMAADYHSPPPPTPTPLPPTPEATEESP